MGTRDERVRDLFFEDPTTPGDPTEEGQVRLNAAGTDLVAHIDGAVRSLTGGAADSLLGKAIFTTTGGMVYDTSGDVLIKVTQ